MMPSPAGSMKPFCEPVIAKIDAPIVHPELEAADRAARHRRRAAPDAWRHRSRDAPPPCRSSRRWPRVFFDFKDMRQGERRLLPVHAAIDAVVRSARGCAAPSCTRKAGTTSTSATTAWRKAPGPRCGRGASRLCAQGAEVELRHRQRDPRTVGHQRRRCDRRRVPALQLGARRRIGAAWPASSSGSVTSEI